MLLKLVNFSLNPFWIFTKETNGGFNATGLALALLALCEKAQRKPVGDIPSSSTFRAARGSAIAAGVGLGAVLFAVHTFMADAGTIIAWTWVGYPIRGPVAIPHSALTIIAFGLGLSLPLHAPALPSSWLWYAIGCSGCYVLHAYDSWQALWGGLMLVIFLATQLPLVVQSAMRYPAWTLGVGWMTYDLFVFVSVFTVAYAFVPGGQYFRECTPGVLIVTMLAIGIGLWNSRSMALLRVTSRIQQTRAYTNRLVSVCVVLAVAGAVHRMQRPPPSPLYAEQRILTAGIWYVFGLFRPDWTSNMGLKDSTLWSRWQDVGESKAHD